MSDGVRCALLAFLVLLPLATRGAAQAQAPHVDITVDVPCYIYARPHGAPTFTPLTQGPARSATYPVADLNGRYDFRAEGPAGVLHEWVGVLDDYPANVRVNLKTQRVLRWRRVLALCAIAATLTTVLAWAALKRARTASEDLQAARAELSDAEARGGLFPIDGSLPTRVGAYRVKRKLGAGGMAVVYEVESTRGQTLALKLPMPHLLENADFRKRFARELTVCMRLNHPNLVHIVEVNTGEGGGFPYPFLVMEHITGVPLDASLTRHGPADPRRAVDLGCQLLDALSAVHAHGIVHRDVKPSNIMVMSNGRLKLMDFGIAYREDTSEARLTSSDQVLGTPFYVAPEMLSEGRIDRRADIYAVGIVLYEMLAGRVPFEGDNPLTVMQAKLVNDPPTLSKFRPNLPPRLETVIMTMLARDPAARFADASHAREHLANALPHDAPPP